MEEGKPRHWALVEVSVSTWGVNAMPSLPSELTDTHLSAGSRAGRFSGWWLAWLPQAGLTQPNIQSLELAKKATVLAQLFSLACWLQPRTVDGRCSHLCPPTPHQLLQLPVPTVPAEAPCAAISLGQRAHHVSCPQPQQHPRHPPESQPACGLPLPPLGTGVPQGQLGGWPEETSQPCKGETCLSYAGNVPPRLSWGTQRW